MELLTASSSEDSLYLRSPSLRVFTQLVTDSNLNHHRKKVVWHTWLRLRSLVLFKRLLALSRAT